MERALHRQRDRTSQLAIVWLLYGTSCLGEYGAGIGTDEPYCSDNNDEDYRQHHGVLGDVLALIITPEVIKHRHGWTPQRLPSRDEKLGFAVRRLSSASGVIVR
jgi:hypothetical protein